MNKLLEALRAHLAVVGPHLTVEQAPGQGCSGCEHCDLLAAVAEYDAKPGWTRQYPKSPGWYWFEGTSAFERRRPDCAVQRFPVHVRPIDNGRLLIWTRDGAFMHPGSASEGWEGWWIPMAEPPPVPTEVP